MAFGENHSLAVTEEGSVLAWGGNKNYQLGNGTSNNVLVPEQVSALNNHRVVDVACGSQHTLALTQNGEVFSWGSIRGKDLDPVWLNVTSKLPMKVNELIDSHRASAIGCCWDTSFVLTDDGQVYSWGHRIALGFKIDSLSKLIPTRIDGLNGVIVRRLACGASHVLALAEDESIYVWGDNDYGQLGTGDQIDRKVPVKLEVPGVRFVAVAASFYKDLSVALDVNGTCWVWGEDRDYNWIEMRPDSELRIPTPVRSASVHDAFAEFDKKPATWKPFLVRQPPTNRVIDRFKSAFGDPTTSDFKFIVDGKPIHVHKSVLKIQFQHFKTMFSGDWSESDQNEVEVERWSYPVFYAFLNYLYTDEVVDLPIDEIIQLIDLANFYLESELETKCHRLFRQNLFVKNVALAYASASQSNAKSIEEYCFQFIVDHLNDVEKTKAFQSLDEEIKKKFICPTERANKKLKIF